MDRDFAVVTPADVDPESFDTVDLDHLKYTTALGCTETRVNLVTLDPGEGVTPHGHERQEELFVPLTGGQIEIEGERYDVPQGGVVRVGPRPIRCVVNETDDETHTWIMIGAPPVGTADDFGEYVLPGDTPAEGVGADVDATDGHEREPSTNPEGGDERVNPENGDEDDEGAR
jgi:mannose-6-phosphate isomerase-like protein (cupin superfamily)